MYIELENFTEQIYSPEHEGVPTADATTHIITRAAEKQTGLHEAAKTGALNVVQTLLANLNGTAFTAKNHKGWTPLHWAASGGHEDVVMFLLEKEQDVNMKN